MRDNPPKKRATLNNLAEELAPRSEITQRTALVAIMVAAAAIAAGVAAALLDFFGSGWTDLVDFDVEVERQASQRMVAVDDHDLIVEFDDRDDHLFVFFFVGQTELHADFKIIGTLEFIASDFEAQLVDTIAIGIGGVDGYLEVISSAVSLEGLLQTRDDLLHSMHVGQRAVFARAIEFLAVVVGEAVLDGY
jgi:hypothetical protein